MMAISSISPSLVAAALLLSAPLVSADFYIWNAYVRGQACGVGAAGCPASGSIWYTGMTAIDDNSCGAVGTFLSTQGSRAGVAYCPADPSPDGYAPYSFQATNCGFDGVTFYVRQVESVAPSGQINVALDEAFTDVIASCSNTGGQVDDADVCTAYDTAGCILGPDGTGSQDSAYWYCSDLNGHTSCNEAA